jgi:hypothetical protein
VHCMIAGSSGRFPSATARDHDVGAVRTANMADLPLDSARYGL